MQKLTFIDAIKIFEMVFHDIVKYKCGGYISSICFYCTKFLQNLAVIVSLVLVIIYL